MAIVVCAENIKNLACLQHFINYFVSVRFFTNLSTELSFQELVIRRTEYVFLVSSTSTKMFSFPSIKNVNVVEAKKVIITKILFYKLCVWLCGEWN